MHASKEPPGQSDGVGDGVGEGDGVGGGGGVGLGLGLGVGAGLGLGVGAGLGLGVGPVVVPMAPTRMFENVAWWSPASDVVSWHGPVLV